MKVEALKFEALKSTRKRNAKLRAKVARYDGATFKYPEPMPPVGDLVKEFLAASVVRVEKRADDR